MGEWAWPGRATKWKGLTWAAGEPRSKRISQADGDDLVGGYEIGKRACRGWMGAAEVAEKGPRRRAWIGAAWAAAVMKYERRWWRRYAC